MTNNTFADRYLVELATGSDSQQILDIYEEEAAPGNPSLLFTRRPDAVQSMMREGEHVIVMICRNRFNNEIAGFGACSINRCFVGGVVKPVAYLFGLRCRKSYRNKAAYMIPKIYNRIRNELANLGVDCIITTILSDNLPAKKLLCRKHNEMPRYSMLGTYEVFALYRRKKRRNSLPAGITCVPAREVGRDRLMEFLQTQGHSRNFFPCMGDSRALPEDFFDECLVLWNQQNSTILAAGYCWDQRLFKQYIITGYRGIHKFLRHFSFLLKWAGFPPLQAPGSVLNMRSLSFFIVRNEQNDYFEWFLDEVMRQSKGTDFILIGAGPGYPHRAQLLNHPHWMYSSDVYHVSWEEQLSRVAECEAPTYLQCGRL